MLAETLPVNPDAMQVPSIFLNLVFLSLFLDSTIFLTVIFLLCGNSLGYSTISLSSSLAEPGLIPVRNTGFIDECVLL